MIKKSKFVTFLIVSTCFLILLLIMTSKVLTIRSGKVANNQQKQENKTTEKVEMEKVRSEYEKGILKIAENLEVYIEDFEEMMLVDSTEVNDVELGKSKERILKLQDDLTSLLVPPEYRKKHLNQVLLFTKIELADEDNGELLEYYRTILSSIKDM